MKIRNGFVSNSSSSSFVIGVKGSEPPTKEQILKVLKVDESSPLYNLVKDVVDVLYNVELLECSDDLQYYVDEEMLKLKDDYIWYIGNAWDDADGIERAIANGLSIKCKTDDIIIHCEGGY
jgi:hypothetical protein